MINSKETHTANYYQSVNAIPQTVWEQLGCTKNIYFTPAYLSSLELNNSHIDFAYIILKDDNNNPIALSSIQIVDFYIDGIKNNFESIIKNITRIGSKIGCNKAAKPLKILISGNSFVSGEHGIYIKNNQHKKTIIKQLAKSILNYVNTDSILKKEISIFMIKDFIDDSLQITDELHTYNYYSFHVDPNMVLYLDQNWECFDDYLAAMKTKFRVKAKKALKQSSDIIIEEIDSNNIEEFLPKMTELYKKVSTKADFNLASFNLSTYKSLKKEFGDLYILRAYCIQNKVVGFLSGLVNNNTLDAHFVGIDYNLNKEYAIYQRMLYDYIDTAISLKLSSINFGRTASEIKSSVGAVPQNLTIYLRHKQSIKNKILKLFLQKIEPTSFQQKIPFKKVNTND